MLRKNLIGLFFLIFIENFAYTQILVQEFSLKNELQVLLIPQKGSPTVSCQLFYHTGSIHETPGNSGIAHLLEHMLFKGSKKTGIKDASQDSIFLPLIDSLWQQTFLDSNNQAKTANYQEKLEQYRSYFIPNELWNAYLQAGGTNLNAFTSSLITGYTVTLPKNKLELFFWLESDRMQNAVLRDFYTERDVVIEERRMRYEDSPYGLYFEKLKGIFYEAHPYRIPTIGYASDIKNLTRNQAYKHYQQYYKPNNATLILIGDFNVKQTYQQITRYFSNIKKGKTPPKIHTRDPKPSTVKILHQKSNQVSPRVDFWFKVPGFPHQSIYALEILAGILNGKSGKLYTHFVTEKKLAVSTSAYLHTQPHHSLFGISFQLAPKTTKDMLQKELQYLLDSVLKNPISARELQKVKNNIRYYFLNQLKEPEMLSVELAFYQALGNWNYINEIPKQLNQTTSYEIKKAIQELISLQKVTIGSISP